jgi:uncharacterized membrane protein (UPF0136 family)
METTAKKSKALIFFGIYLIVAGLAGYLSNPTKAATALFSGGLFGLLSIGSGFLLKQGKQWALKVGITLSSFLVLVFSWRASVGWIAVYNGNSEKLFASALISSMLIAALLTLFLLYPRTAIKNPKVT